ncbi:hypothetical protein [Butyrivibrio sp. WCE2006]|uniref:hypothetical protein n=1 Tax=Butyrivibrio sp. WCE2006 TaxID=1410611 RepID=UPI0005D28AF5|nr:hypothetical protein [Butyrivibrio sp. WCE2006]
MEKDVAYDKYLDTFNDLTLCICDGKITEKEIYDKTTPYLMSMCDGMVLNYGMFNSDVEALKRCFENIKTEEGAIVVGSILMAVFTCIRINPASTSEEMYASYMYLKK